MNKKLRLLTGFESLDNFLKNISHASKYSDDFKEEIEFIENIIKYSISTNKAGKVTDFIYILGRIDNQTFLEFFIRLIYSLKNEFKKINDLMILEELFYIFIKSNFESKEKFNSKLNTSGLYLREFLNSIFYGELLEKAEDKNILKEYSQAIELTIKRLYLLNKNILELKLDNNLKLEYLTNQISELNKCLEHYDRVHEIDLLSDYYKIVFKKESDTTEIEKEKIKLVKLKMKMIKELQEELKKKQIKLFYLILSKIYKENLSKEFFNLAYKFLKTKGFREKFNESDDADLVFDHDLDKIDFFASNVGSSSGFNTFRYRLIIYFYEFLQNEDSLKGNIALLKKENFTTNLSEIKSTISNMDVNFVEKFFKLSKEQIKKLPKFREKIFLHFEKKKKENETKEMEYIANSSVNDKNQKHHKEKFKKDCLESWEKLQRDLKKIFDYKEVENIPELKDYFGKYTLFPKMWLLESFYETVGLDRNAGNDFGRDQVVRKKKQIFKEVEELLKNLKPKKLSGFEEISNYFKGSEKKYYLIYGKKFEIYTIKGIDWKGEELQDGEMKIGNSSIHFIRNPNFDSEENFLFEENAFILEQSKKGFKDADSPLNIEVRDLTNEEIKNILSKGKFKNELEVKQNVVVRITEQFKLRRNKNKFACKIQI